MAILEARNIEYHYQDGETYRTILTDTNCSFEQGRFYAIRGQSGSGKTTFLSLLGALDKPKSGTILYQGTDIHTIGLEKYRRNSVGIIFQSYNLIPYMTALENILLAMSITDNALPRDQKTVANNLLDYIGISRSKAGRKVTMLSGGEQQRVAIARALATNIDVVLADEPTGNLDEEIEQEIIDIFKELAHVHNKCVVVVTHSAEISDQADQVFSLHKGRLTNHE